MATGTIFPNNKQTKSVKCLNLTPWKEFSSIKESCPSLFQEEKGLNNEPEVMQLL